LYAQPFNETYITNKYAEENIFKKLPEDISTPVSFEAVKNKRPGPNWDARPDVIKCYWRT